MTTSAISRRFEQLSAARRRALVCYVTAGHPDQARSVALIRGIAEAGADIIEVGVPFSDPLADGPVIQRSSQIAIEQGMTLERSLALIAEADVDVPIVLSLLSLKLGRSIKFDPTKERIVGDSEAAKLAVPQYRSPWKFPKQYLS